LHEHRRDQEVQARIALMITSDSRTPETDETGKTAMKLLEEAGHVIAAYTIVKNDSGKIAEVFEAFRDDGDVQVIITSGGTGIGVKDKTVDTVTGRFDRRLEGFGELFRRLSFDDIGIAAMISRATAGVSGEKIVFCLPGSKGAMEMALTEIIIPALGHMIWELNRK
jgi:molybdenum cofactor biosynthesis protein B